MTIEKLDGDKVAVSAEAMRGLVNTTTQHELKADSATFQAVASGAKTHEVRFNDRNFKVGDVLNLLETVSTGAEMRDGAVLEYTGGQIIKKVSHVLTGYGLMPGWVILSFAPDEADSFDAALAAAPLVPPVAQSVQDEYDAFSEWYVKDAPRVNEVTKLDMARHAWLAGRRSIEFIPLKSANSTANAGEAAQGDGR